MTDVCHVEFFDQGVSSFSIAPGLTLTESMKASGTNKGSRQPEQCPHPLRLLAGWLDGSALRQKRRPTQGKMVSSRSRYRELNLVEA